MSGKIRQFTRIMTVYLITLLLVAVTGPAQMDAHASSSEQKVLDPPRNPSDLPDPREAPPARRTGQDVAFRIVLFFVVTALFALKLYTLYDPQDAYLLFRRHLKYRSDEELSAAYRSLLRLGAVVSIILFSVLLLLSGEGIILLLSWAAVGVFSLGSKPFSIWA